MPGRDGTGPFGSGPRGGRGMGRGQGLGRTNPRGIRPGMGPGGECRCPGCGTKVSHQPGVPCSSLNCPKCGRPMVRG